MLIIERISKERVNMMIEVKRFAEEAPKVGLSSISKEHLSKKEDSRMFNFITKTWNPVVGCKYDCCYCWARRLAKGKLKDTTRYKNGFHPQKISKELHKRFYGEKIVFVSDMGDLWGDWVPTKWIEAVLDTIKSSESSFLFLTKNPNRYLELLDIIPKNGILGATVETNRDTSPFSKAPLPLARLKAMETLRLNWNGDIMISIEPIMDFDSIILLKSLQIIKPSFVVIGKDNYKNNLPEPDLEKILSFSSELECFTRVIFKNSLRKVLY